MYKPIVITLLCENCKGPYDYRLSTEKEWDEHLALYYSAYSTSPLAQIPPLNTRITEGKHKSNTECLRSLAERLEPPKAGRFVAYKFDRKPNYGKIVLLAYLGLCVLVMAAVTCGIFFGS